MSRYEYKVLPAPKKPGKIKGVRGTDAKFAVAISQLMNELAAEGWEYQRTDTLPCEERQGFTGRVTTFQNMLIFRRELAAQDLDQTTPQPVAAQPVAAQPVAAQPAVAAAPPQPAPAAPEVAASPRLVSEAAEAPVLSFRSGSQQPSAAAPAANGAAPAPAITPARDVPEGKAPPVSLHRAEPRPEHAANA